MNFAEVKVLDCEEFRCTRNVSKVHGSILPQRIGSSLQGPREGESLGPSRWLAHC
jgi:hypothetical protein